MMLLPILIVSPILVALVALDIITISRGELGASQDAAFTGYLSVKDKINPAGTDCFTQDDSSKTLKQIP
jgi:hypothetical protein